MKYATSIATNVPIFSGSVDSWTIHQVQFVTWCQFYYDIYSDPEKPSDKIINDDMALDNYRANVAMQKKKEKILAEREGSNLDRRTR